jgi:hypothetical protein
MYIMFRNTPLVMPLTKFPIDRIMVAWDVLGILIPQTDPYGWNCIIVERTVI